MNKKKVQPRPDTTLNVEIQHDRHGDIVYALMLRTYSRQAVRWLEENLDVDAQWRKAEL